MEVAARLVLEQGYLPLPPERLGKAAGVSKASVYGYFPDQHELFNAILTREFEAMTRAGLDAAAAGPDLAKAADATADLYFRHVARHGPVAHVILRDVYMARRVDRGVAAVRDRAAGRLARLARKELGLPAREALAAFNLVLTIPEEAGRLVWQGDLGFEDGADLCRRLTASSVAALSR